MKALCTTDCIIGQVSENDKTRSQSTWIQALSLRVGNGGLDQIPAAAGDCRAKKDRGPK